MSTDRQSLGIARASAPVRPSLTGATPNAAASVATAPASFSGRLKFAAYRTAARVIPWLPAWLTYPAARGAGFLLWALRPGMRERADANLRHVPTLAADERQRRRAVRRAFGNLALNYLDLFTVRHRTVEQVAAELHVDGLDLLEAAVRRGRGVLVLAAHLGDFDRAITLVAGVGAPVWLPVERLEPPEVFALCRDLRSHHGVRAVPADSSRALRELFAALRRGEVVLITADRDVLGTGIEVPFFGAPARLPVGPLVLARRTGATVVGAFSWRLAGRRSAGHFLPVDLSATGDMLSGPSHAATLAVADPATRDRDHDHDHDRDRHVWGSDLLPIAHLLETEIAAHPEQWVAAFTPIWDSPPAAQDGKDAPQP